VRPLALPAVSFLVALAASLLLGVPAARAWHDLGDDLGGPYNPRGGYIIDGSYVMNASELQVNITNWGLIGSHFSSATPYSDQPSAQWPAGSGNEYLYAAGLWVGGVVLGERLVSTGQPQTEIRARGEIPEDTIYEAIGGKLVRPPGNVLASGRRFPEPEPNDDGDLDPSGRERVDEETLNGYDDDGDGLVDEDFGQIGNQMMVTTMYDNTRLAAERYPDHTPLNVQVVQASYAWENDQVDDMIGLEYTITNIGVTSISNVYIGFYADSDIGPRGGPETSRDDMAGSFSGAIRASDGSWVAVNVGYMYDAAEQNRLDGYFGIALLGKQLRSFQSFSGQRSFDQGGDPTNDAERYELLSRAERDPDTQPGREDDFRFILSTGPFEELETGRSLTLQVALAVGDGLQGLLATCAEAALTWYGSYFNVMPDNYESYADTRVRTGVLGRETLVCREDVGAERFDEIRPDYGDESCVGFAYLMAQPVIAEEDMFDWYDPVTGQRKTCAMVNMDNCFECFRQKPHFPGESFEQSQCTESDVIDFWTCNTGGTAGCTGIDGNETQVNWLVGMAPPPPGLRIVPSDGRVHVFWNNRSEITPDVRINVIDFEAYRVWRADNWTRPFGSSLENGPPSTLWQLIGEFDLVDSLITIYRDQAGRIVGRDTLPLGANTGLEAIRYVPVAWTDPAYDGLHEAMQAVVDRDSSDADRSRPAIRDRFGEVIPGMEPLVPWETEPAVLDTFWTLTARAESVHVDPDTGERTTVVVGKDATDYYEFVDSDVHNGFIYFYSVTATDKDLRPRGRDDYYIAGAGLAGDPSSSFQDVSPAVRAQTAAQRERDGINIFAYPNPATRDALAKFQELNPNMDDPTGVRVNFANLPAARNTVEIFTLAGDLVKTIEHDGTGGYGEASWNLISRNGQEVVSGIYLYVVHSDDSRFEDFIGKFVLVR